MMPLSYVLAWMGAIYVVGVFTGIYLCTRK